MVNKKPLGITMVILAFLIWGVSPIYFKTVGIVSPAEILAHRVIWSFVLLIIIIFFKKQFPQLKRTLTSKKNLSTLLVTTLLISSNWFVYIWSVLHNHLIEASFGYFVTPIINIFLGMVLLKEQLTSKQKLSLLLTVLAVLSQVLFLGTFPWISLYLAISFSLYGLIRKQMSSVDSIVGLFVETLILLPLSVSYLVYLGVTDGEQLMFLTTVPITLLLILAGFITAIPLLFYVAGARLLPLSVVGFFQYISPTCQFLLAIFLFNEPFSQFKFFSYCLIWLALFIYIIDTTMNAKKSSLKISWKSVFPSGIHKYL